ncbi:ORF6N domain-containing protein [Serratia marcescens]|uniref:ORF6N domain-containing protein n=1 Tax=Serratia marcescens TaxID=615 RepID=UPI00124AB9AA|nr:ORF6N domain-containing protein [Serratia marcescens]KAB1578717.1 ORF6N domain-containing protein [Serratia marcescens]
MKSQISAENLQPVLHDGVKVITTELLAQLYGTEPVRIRQNHHENKVRFVEGKHYIKVTGKALTDLRVALNYSQNQPEDLRLSLSESQNQSADLRVALNYSVEISPKARALILWTERGAARHAKMLETDQAWEVFEKLEDFYFTKDESAHERRQEKLPGSVLVPHQPTYISCRVLHTYNEMGIIVSSQVAKIDEMLTSPKGFIELMMRRQGI